MKTSPSKFLLRVAAVASVAATFSFSSPAQAQSWTGGNATSDSWGATSQWSSVPAFNNTTGLTFNVLTRPNTWIGGNRTIKSLAYGADIDSALGINLQDFNFGAARNLTFDTDVVGGNATISVASGATGNITIGNATSTSGAIGAVVLADNLVVDHNGSGNLNFNRAITGAGFSVTKTGTGTMVFNSIGSSPNTFSGNMNINQGRLVANGFIVATDLNNAANINMGGGTLEVQNVSGANKDYTTVGFNVNSASTLAFANKNNTTYTLTFSGANAFALNANLTVQNISSNATLGNGINISRSITGSGAMSVETYNNVTSGESDFALGRVNLSGNNTGWSGGLVISTGTANLGGNSTLGSGVGVNAGTGSITLGQTGNTFGAGLQLGAATGGGQQNITNNIIVTAGGYRGIKLFSDHTYSLNGTIDLQGDLNLHNAAFNNDKRIIVEGNISGVGGLSITEALSGAKDFIRLSGNNTYTGATTIGTNATLSVLSASGNGIGDSSAVSLVGSGSALTISSNETIGSLTSAGAVGTLVLASNTTLTTGGTNASTSYGGTSSGAGSLTKVGSGNMTFTAAQGYTGTTTVSSGTLLLASGATLASTNIQVSNAATLDVSALAGGLTIASGNRIGGDGSVTGDLTLASGSKFVFSLTSTLDVSGTVTTDTSFGVASLVNSDGSAIDWSLVGNGVYTLIGSTTTVFSASNIGNFDFANRVVNIGGTGKDVYFSNGSLQLNVIPEPATWLLLSAGLTTLAVRRRRRCNGFRAED
jgi:autotransporter-associated beta strand protein